MSPCLPRKAHVVADVGPTWRRHLHHIGYTAVGWPWGRISCTAGWRSRIPPCANTPNAGGQRLIQKAKDGDVAAAKILFERATGPAAALDFDLRLTELENQVFESHNKGRET